MKGTKKARLNRLSEIFADMGTVAIASVVLPFVIDKFNPVMIVWGLVIAIVFWVFSILLAQ